jgi:hypothetical protein
MAVSLPGRDGIFRTAVRAGLAPEQPEEEGLLRIAIPASLTPRIPGGC